MSFVVIQFEYLINKLDIMLTCTRDVGEGGGTWEKEDVGEGGGSFKSCCLSQTYSWPGKNLT